MTIEHDVIPNAKLHEPKDVSAATAGQVYISDGAGSGSWTTLLQGRSGWWFYQNTASAISLSTADTDFNLVSDGLGARNTIAFGLTEQANIWNTSTNRFDFSSLPLGLLLDIRLDVTFVTTGANTSVSLGINFELGGSVPFTLNFLDDFNHKAAGTYIHTISTTVFLNDASTLSSAAEIVAQADNSTSTCVLNNLLVQGFIGTK